MPVENDKFENLGEKIISPFDGLIPGTSPTASPIDPSEDDIRLLIKIRIVPTFVAISSTSIKVIFAMLLI